MAFGDSNRVALGLKEETNWGEWPAAGDIKEIRYTSDTFGSQQDTIESGEVRPDRQVPDIIRTSVSAQGGFEGELSYGVESFEALLKGILGPSSGFGTAPSALVGAIDAQASDNTFRSDSTGSGVDFSSISVGDWIRASGFTNEANNGYFQVTAVDTATASDHNITVVGATLVDESGGGDKTVQGSAVIRNGTTKYSFAVEKQFQDLSLAARILGYRAGSISLSLEPNSVLSYTINGQGKQVSDTAGTDLTNTGATLDFSTLSGITAAAANNVMRTVDGIGTTVINRDDPISGITFQSMSLDAQSNLRRQEGLKEGIGSLGIGIGRFGVSGEITAYFESKALLEEYLLFRDMDIAVVVKDGANNAYLVDIPSFKLGGDAVPKGTGTDQDVITTGSLAAKRSTRYGLDYMMGIHKFAG